jgi:hypothetical protein
LTINDDAYECFKTILDSVINTYKRVDSHYRYKTMLQEKKILELSDKCNDQERAIQNHEKKEKNYIFQSSIDATRTIDCHISEFIDAKEQITRADYTENQYSSLDNDLSSLYELCHIVGKGKCDKAQFIETFQNFGDFHDLIQNNGKSLQIFTSKMISDLLIVQPPLCSSACTQTAIIDEIDVMSEHNERMGLLQRDLSREHTLNHRLGEIIKQNEKDKSLLRGCFVDLQIELSDVKKEILICESINKSKRSEIRMMNDLVKKVGLCNKHL